MNHITVVSSIIMLLFISICIYCIKLRVYISYMKEEIASMLKHDAQKILLEIVRDDAKTNLEILQDTDEVYKIVKEFFNSTSLEDAIFSKDEQECMISFLKWSDDILKYTIQNKETHRIEFLTNGTYHERLSEIKKILNFHNHG